MTRIALAVVVLVCGRLPSGAEEPPTLKDDVKTLTTGTGEWKRPADKGPKWLRLKFEVFEGNLHAGIFVYRTENAKNLSRGRFGGVFHKEEKTGRVIQYSLDEKHRFTYQLKDNTLIVDGSYEIEPGEVYDLSGTWELVEKLKNNEKK
jgi:hypothetical protein